jgi:pSer/pThr/pTyr-binding forkhead associated (FHA) protein
MDIKLTIIGGMTRKSHVNVKLPATIGRSREADLTIAHPTVSRQHCRLFEVDGLLRVRDMGSMNGTLVCGDTITEAPLRPNDEFTVGPVTFRVDYDYDGEATAEGPASRASAMDSQPPEHDMIELVAENVTVVRDEAHDGPAAPGLRETFPAEQAGGMASDVAMVAPPPEVSLVEDPCEPAAESPALGLAPPDGQLPDFIAWEQKARATQAPAAEAVRPPPAATQPEPQPTPPPPAPDAGPPPLRPPPHTKAPKPTRSKLPARAPSDSGLENFFNAIQ